MARMMQERLMGSNIAKLISEYGFLNVAAWHGIFRILCLEVATTEVKSFSAKQHTLIALIDRIRMLDNDLIRLNQKVDTVLHLRGKTIEHERVEAEHLINQPKERR
jgi:hypothetical protein